jgi:hypothetical protein
MQRVNIYTPDRVRIWLRLSPEDGFELEELSSVELVGEPPEWLDTDVRESGWDSVLGVPWLHTTKDEDGNDWSEGLLLWALWEGIAPGQPFLVELLKPHWYRCGGYEYPDEWDVEYSAEVLAVYPWPTKRVADAWERELKDTLADRKQIAKERRELKKLQETDVSSMSLVRTDFCTGRCCHECCCGAHGVRYKLVSKASLKKDDRWAYAELVWGEDRGGDWDKAMEDLLANISKRLPHLDLELVKKMPSQWRG